MSISSIRQAGFSPRRPLARAAQPARVMTDGAPPQAGPIRPRSTPTQREVKQHLLDSLLAGANGNKIRDIATGRPDLMEAASPEQRGRMTKVLLDKYFFNSSDRQAVLGVLNPALAIGELPQSLGAVKVAGRLAALYKQMGDLDEGLVLARTGLKGGVYDDMAVIEDLGRVGTRALVRVATDEQLDATARTSKQAMIATLQAGPVDDETEVMIRRLRNHLG